MSHYSKGVIVTDAKLSEMQQAIITPVGKTAFGGLHKYANVNRIPLEKEVIEDEIVASYLSEKENF